MKVGKCNAGAEFENINPVCRCSITHMAATVNGIDAISYVPNIGIVSFIFIIAIIACAADDPVIAVLALQKIIAAPAIENIVPCASKDAIVTIATIENIVASVHHQRPLEHIVRRPTASIGKFDGLNRRIGLT